MGQKYDFPVYKLELLESTDKKLTEMPAEYCKPTYFYHYYKHLA